MRGQRRHCRSAATCRLSRSCRCKITGIERVRLSAQEGENHAQDDADNDASDDGKVEPGAAAFDPNVARQAPEPVAAKASPKNCADECDHDPEDDEQFAHFVHL